MSKPKKPLISWLEATPVVRAIASSTSPAGFNLDAKWFAASVTDFDLWLVCEGRADLALADGGRVLLARGSLVCLRPGQAVGLEVVSNSPYTNLYVHFDFVDSRGTTIPPGQIDMPTWHATATNMLFFEAAMRQMIALEFLPPPPRNAKRDTEQRKAIQTRILDCLLRCMAAGWISPRSRGEAVVASALSWVASNPGTAANVPEVARRFGCSHRHFGRLFHGVLGKSPALAFQEIRIDHAKALLATSALSITEIADSLGYGSVFYFSRHFKRSTGLSPGHYRKTLHIHTVH